MGNANSVSNYGGILSNTNQNSTDHQSPNAEQGHLLDQYWQQEFNKN
jgi:hypothetical protein